MKLLQQQMLCYNLNETFKVKTMYRKMKLTIVVLMFLSTHSSFGQTRHDVDLIYQQCQECLDNTGQTAKCQNILYDKLDSVLNVAYKKLMKVLPDTKKAVFKKDQLAWLQKRDAYFIKSKKEVAGKTEPGTEIFDTQLLEKENEYVRTRVLALIDKL